MTAPLSGQFRSEPSKVGGMFGGPRGSKGKYDQGNINKLSGTTYGGQGLGWFWNGYPNVIGGLTEYDPGATMPGSNLEAVGAGEVPSERKVGGGVPGAMDVSGETPATTTGQEMGGTAAS